MMLGSEAIIFTESGASADLRIQNAIVASDLSMMLGLNGDWI
jgi:hypothetical protein